MNDRSSSAEMINAAGFAYGDLIREYRRKKGMSQEQLGRLAHVRKNAVGAWEAGRSRPDLSSVPVLCEALDLPLYTFFGVDEPSVSSGLSARYDRLNDYNRRVILRQMDVLYDLQDHPAPVCRKLIRLYRNDLTAAAGYSYSIGDPSGETVYVAADANTSMADEIIRVSGDSMEPTFHDGDQVLVQHNACLQEGDIGIFVNGDTGYIKEYRKDGLHSHNPAYPVFRFSQEDNVRCIGKVLGILDPSDYATPEEIASWTGNLMKG